jgi:hypothetical protein
MGFSVFERGVQAKLGEFGDRRVEALMNRAI